MLTTTDVVPAVESSVHAPFIERRRTAGLAPSGRERRQFGNTHTDQSPEGRRLAEAIDQYKVENRRRFLTADELLTIVMGLGYRCEGTV